MLQRNIKRVLKTQILCRAVGKGGKGRERHAHPPPPFPVKSENIKFLNVKNRLEFIY